MHARLLRLRAEVLAQAARTILIVADAAAFPAADDSTGWIFHPKTGKLRANSTGTAPNGKNYYDF